MHLKTDFIEKLPQSYNTVIGENGIRLSGGQKQRIGIARALYKNSEVIIFDESTSALDKKTESLIFETINNLPKNITIIIISHNHTNLRNCDKILNIESSKKIDIEEITQRPQPKEAKYAFDQQKEAV